MSAIIKDIITTDQESYLKKKEAIFRKIRLQLISLVLVLALFILAAIPHYNLEKKLSLVDKGVYKEKSEINNSILVNNYVDKAISDSNELQLEGRKICNTLPLKTFEETLSHLAYYHEIKSPIKASITPITGKKSILPIRVSLSVSSRTDTNIIRFLDSLLLNLHGFVLIQKIDMIQNPDSISSDIIFDWYTTSKIREACMEKRSITIQTEKPNFTVEEKYRISVWNSSIVSM